MKLCIMLWKHRVCPSSSELELSTSTYQNNGFGELQSYRIMSLCSNQKLQVFCWFDRHLHQHTYRALHDNVCINPSSGPSRLPPFLLAVCRAWCYADIFRLERVSLFLLVSQRPHQLFLSRFCSVVWGRRNRQLKAWELEEPDSDGILRPVQLTPEIPDPLADPKSHQSSASVVNDETADPIPDLEIGGYSNTSTSPLKLRNPIFGDVLEEYRPQASATHRNFADKGLIAPFASPPASEDGEAKGDDISISEQRADKFASSPTTEQPTPKTQKIMFGTRNDHTQRIGSSSVDKGGSLRNRGKGKSYTRPPVFGPEVVIQDPHIIVRPIISHLVSLY